MRNLDRIPANEGVGEVSESCKPRHWRAMVFAVVQTPGWFIRMKVCLLHDARKERMCMVEASVKQANVRRYCRWRLNAGNKIVHPILLLDTVQIGKE